MLARAERLDMALISVGDLAPNSTLMRHNLVSHEMIAQLRQSGAVADLLCQFIDANGTLVDHAANHWVLAADLASLRQTPRLVLASGGWQKVGAMRAAIGLMRPTVLITDQIAAEGLLTAKRAAS